MIEMKNDSHEFIPGIADFFGFPYTIVNKYYQEIKEIQPIRWGGGTVEPTVAQLLYIITRITKPQEIVEFGTNVGYSTWFISKAMTKNGHGRFLSFDIDPEVVKEAKKNLSDIPVGLILGDSISEESKNMIRSISPIDLAFIDSSHEYEQTNQELKFLFEVMNFGCILLHDIFSDGVKRAVSENIDSCKYLEIPTQINTGFGVILF